jgi:HrpA-like RNA helicase
VGEEGASEDIEKADELYLTPIGKFMVSMPCDLQISKMILMGLKLRIPKLIISIGSILMSSKPFFAHE